MFSNVREVPHLPFHVIFGFCDIDTRRALRLPPRRLGRKALSGAVAALYPRRCTVPIPGTDKELLVDHHEQLCSTTYWVSRGWLPSASRHVLMYDPEHGRPILYEGRAECA